MPLHSRAKHFLHPWSPVALEKPWRISGFHFCSKSDQGTFFFALNFSIVPLVIHSALTVFKKL
jgi:hypothetical protein